MGLSSKEVSIDDGLDWAMNLLKSDKRPRQQQQQQQQQQHRPPQLNCPRCNSTNTKFCYYNNYNRLQPRHFCKSCKRHWTKGGTLRNVPIGGRRNNKRLKTTNTNKNNSNNNTTGVIGDINFVPQRQSMPLAFEDQKNISEILYQALYQSPSLQPNYINSTFSGSSLCLPSLPNLPFTSSCFSNENPSLLSSSFIGRCESSNVCDYSGDSETAEPITTTISTMDAVTTNPLWKLSNASSLMESDCNWNWDDLNTLISNDLKQPWDDFQTKVQGI